METRDGWVPVASRFDGADLDAWTTASAQGVAVAADPLDSQSYVGSARRATDDAPVARAAARPTLNR